MSFYLFAFLTAYLQSSFLLALFGSSLFTPNFLLAYLFLHLMKEEGYGLKKTLASGLFLDLLQDTPGLNLSGYLLFTLVLNLLKARVEFPTVLSMSLTYLFLTLLERLAVFVVFRLKYFVEFKPVLLVLSLSLELLLVVFLLRKRA